MKPSSTAFYPPLYYKRLRNSNRWLWTWNWGLGLGTGLIFWGYFQGWPAPIWELAPFVGACYAFFGWASFSGWKADRVVRVLPYFKNVDVTVEANTFLRGHALARHFETVEAVAKRLNCEPLSTFGFNDDLHGDTIIWHDATRGLEVVSRLLDACGTESQLEGVTEDLESLKLALEDAARKNVPFCLHLRHGDSFSGAELDMRQGNFGRPTK